MLIQLILFSILLIILFFLSQKIQTSFFNNIFLLTKSKNIAIGFLVVLLLPGTIVHELSHFLIASILRVPTGKLTILPTIEENGEVKAGKLYLANTDPFRLSLIGLAPVIIGLALICFAGKFFLPSFPQPSLINYQLITNIIVFYLLFAVSVTMFSSKKDAESLVLSVPVVLVLLISLYFVGVRIFFDPMLSRKIEKFITDLNYFLTITALLNGAVFILLSVNRHFWEKILKRKINS